MDKIHISIFLILGVAIFLGAMGVIGAQTNSNKINDIETPTEGFDWKSDKEFWKFINDNYVSEGQLNITKKITNAEFATFKNEIVKIKNDIKNKFPVASPVDDEEQSAIADTPFLTLKMDKIEFVLGDSITFRGTAQPNDAILITIKQPDRSLEQHPISKTEIINGQYITEFPTSFDDAPGTWTAYARQGSDQTKVLTFKVE